MANPFTPEEWKALLRCESTLHRWAEMCWSHDVEDDGDKVFVRFITPRGDLTEPQRIPNRRRGALLRASEIAHRHDLKIYEQQDPRGCALYVYDPKKLGDSDIDFVYSLVGLAITKARK